MLLGTSNFTRFNSSIVDGNAFTGMHRMQQGTVWIKQWPSFGDLTTFNAAHE